MIIDKFENFKLYHSSAAWKLIFEFLMSLSPEAEEKKYSLQGDDIFAYVMSYMTKEPESAKLEAHHQYVDIQAVLVGSEGFEWFTKEELEIDKPYNKVSDVTLFKRTSPGQARINLFPGNFIMFYPDDAHMPALTVHGKLELIKKVVVKIKTDLLRDVN